MTRARGLAAAALAALALAGCGGDGDGEPATGDPAARHGERPIEIVLTIERARARLTAASELYATGRAEDALVQLRHARRIWSELSGEVRARDPVLEREISAAFAAVEGDMSRSRPFDTVRDRLSPLGAQLLGGVLDELVEQDARADEGLKAEVLRRLMPALAQAYAQGAGDGPGARLSLEHAYGLLVRAQALTRDIASKLGPKRDAAINGLKDLRSEAFPEGAVLPAVRLPPARVQEAAEAVREALSERFGLARR